MSKFERLLVPGSTEKPDCQCGAEMSRVMSDTSHQTGDAEIRTYRCPACGHELRLTVWTEPVMATGKIGGM